MKYSQYVKHVILEEDIKYICIDKVTQDEERLYIEITMIKKDDTEKKAQIYFEYLLAFKSILDSYALKMDTNPNIKVDKQEDKFCTIYEVKNSKYIEYFYEESLGIPEYAKTPVNHYAVYGTNFCLDILASEPPSIKYFT